MCSDGRKDVKTFGEQREPTGGKRGLIDTGNISQCMYICMKIALCNCMLKDTNVLEPISVI